MSKIRLEIPALHPGQLAVSHGKQRFNTVMCGRRWGKTTHGMHMALEPSIAGQPVGWFAPTYKILEDAWRQIQGWLKPVCANVNQQQKRLEMMGGGVIEFWSLDTPGAGRSRKYARAIIDEAGEVRDLLGCWTAAIRPTLTDMKGDAFVYGTPKGRGGFYKLFARGEAGQDGYASFRGRTIDNPAIDPAEVEAARRDMPDHIFAQEYLGEPSDDGGNPFGLKHIGNCTGDLSTKPVEVYGVDLAKSVDWTVCIGLDENGAVCSFDRWQQIPWGETQRRLAQIIGNTPALVDATGVGDPVVEQLGRECYGITPFVFTQQSKQRLMEGLMAAVQSQEVTFPEGPIRAEMEAFEYKRSGARYLYSAPDGMHDDCVMALALAVQAKTGLIGSTPLISAGTRIEIVDDDDEGWTSWG